ncbi:MAG TPA: prepilin-type N-terminal cleavage/methylation domain-containing protein [Terriglobales bacterium]|nr:prepilin-type N-terminal cleavage/methylation domain-containing protein [Terriglobales bacterium]
MSTIAKLRDQTGFTLVELLVAAGLSLFVLASIGGLFRAQTKTVKGQESRMEAHEYALAVLDTLVREIRNTGYFPSTACNTTGGISAATATSFSMVYDKDANGACSGDDEVIAFAYDGTGRNVTRNGQALSDGNVTAVQFTYYPQQTSGTAPAPYCVSTGVPAGCSGTLSSSFSSVQKIAISLTVQPKNTDTQFAGSPVTMSLTADLRNHGL